MEYMNPDVRNYVRAYWTYVRDRSFRYRHNQLFILIIRNSQLCEYSTVHQTRDCFLIMTFMERVKIAARHTLDDARCATISRMQWLYIVIRWPADPALSRPVRYTIMKVENAFRMIFYDGEEEKICSWITVLLPSFSITTWQQLSTSAHFIELLSYMGSKAKAL